MNLEITNKDELENINFFTLNDGSNYNSISEIVNIQIAVTEINSTVQWLGIRLTIDIHTYDEIFYNNNKRNTYYYNSSNLNNGDVISFNVKFKSTQSVNDLFGSSFGIMLFGKKSKEEGYLQFDNPILMHPYTTEI